MLMKQIERLVAVWQLLAEDTELSAYVTPRDIEVFKTRALAEGIYFLTVTLPQLFKALDLSFETGRLEPIEGFQRCGKSPYPTFLRHAWETIFEEDGRLRWETTAVFAPPCHYPSAVRPWRKLRGTAPSRFIGSNKCENEGIGLAVTCIRQLSAVFYKLEVPYTEQQRSAALDKFKDVEKELWKQDLRPSTCREVFLPCCDCTLEQLLARAESIISRLLGGVSPTDIVPRHGSGASACKTPTWDRWRSFRYIPRLAEVFPYDQYFYSGANHLCDEYHKLTGAELCEEPTARVTFVPKDSRGPRIISCEPRELMFIQQGLMTKLYDTVASHPAIAGMVGFTDQTRNQRLARLGALTGRYATLDLKDASDRVSLWLVMRLFPRNWVEAFLACRSRVTLLPGGQKLALAKFAPMGSALCFPVEALVFWSLSLAAMRFPAHAVKRLFKNRLNPDEQSCLSVFGDDIIVEQPYFEAVHEALEAVGLQVNKAKCYHRGPFRESCGHDYYMNSNVTPVRIAKALRPCSHDDDTACMRLADSLNGIIRRYGSYSSQLVGKCQTLFKEVYGFKPPIVPADMQGRPNSDSFTGKLVLVDPYWGVRDQGETIRPLTKAELRLNKSARPTLVQRVAPVKSQYSEFHYSEIRVLTEVSQSKTVAYHSWSYVLRHLLTGMSQPNPGIWALPKRHRYKYGWTSI